MGNNSSTTTSTSNYLKEDIKFHPTPVLTPCLPLNKLQSQHYTNNISIHSLSTSAPNSPSGNQKTGRTKLRRLRSIEKNTSPQTKNITRIITWIYPPVLKNITYLHTPPSALHLPHLPTPKSKIHLFDQRCHYPQGNKGKGAKSWDLRAAPAWKGGTP